MSGNAISRAELARLVLQVAEDKLSGAVIVQTDDRRSIVLRFSAGKLVRVNVGGNSVEDALETLRQSDQYKFSFARMRVDEGAELIPVPEFVERLGVGEDEAVGATESSALLEAGSAQADDLGGAGQLVASDHEFLRTMLTQLAAGEIGPMASMIVDQAIGNGGSIEEIIAAVAGQMPDNDAAARFTELAIEGAKESC